jgi:cysteinyl-tRNA synthetase
LLEQGVPGEVIRFVMLSTHYRKPMDWTEGKREEARKRLLKWFRKTDGVEPTATIPSRIEAALSDDLNTSLAISEMDNMSAAPLKASMRILGFPDAEGVKWFREQGSLLMGVALIGDGNLSKAQDLLNPVLEKWQQLRTEKNYEAADAIKRELELMQIEVKAMGDGPQATVRNYHLLDPAKLEALK